MYDLLTKITRHVLVSAVVRLGALSMALHMQNLDTGGRGHPCGDETSTNEM